jgi:hypothetical protein
VVVPWGSSGHFYRRRKNSDFLFWPLDVPFQSIYVGQVLHPLYTKLAQNGELRLGRPHTRDVGVPRPDRARWLPGDHISWDSATHVCAQRQIRGDDLTAASRHVWVCQAGTVESSKLGQVRTAPRAVYLEDCGHPGGGIPGRRAGASEQSSPRAVRFSLTGSLADFLIKHGAHWLTF